MPLLSICRQFTENVKIIFHSFAVIPHLASISVNFYFAVEHDDSYEHLVRVNNKSEKIWQLYFKFVMLGFFICTNTLVVISLVHCYIVNGAFDISLVFKPYEVR